MMLVISGCSAVNMTGFEFPVFGLTKKSGDESGALTTSALPTDQEQSRDQSGKLTYQ
jgi:hypothetical protein